MWLWIKRWRDWAMHDFPFMHRICPQPQALHFGYEKAGLTVYDQPIPWNAEVVQVEALLRPTTVARRKQDFHLVIAGHPPFTPENLRRKDKEERLTFRIPPPSRSATAELFWRQRRLGQITLPILSREEFVQGLQLQMPTVFARLGEQSVACQTFVSTQCRGLTACALISAPTSLIALQELGLRVQFRADRTGVVDSVPVQLSSSQMSERHALVTVAPRKLPKRVGTWTVTWLLGDHPLTAQRIRAISTRHFERSLHLSDSRFIVQPARGSILLARHLPPMEDVSRAGPCFLVISREPGMAGLCSMRVSVQLAGSTAAPPAQEQEILITDGPTMVIPGTLDPKELSKVSAFELYLKGQMLGVLSLRPIPVAAFTPEGGFKQAPEYSWTTVADDELNDRLERLMEGPRKSR